MNAKKSQVDLTTCSLYTTNYPCAHCIMAILRCGIRVVVHGGEKDKYTKEMVNQAKACFKYIHVILFAQKYHFYSCEGNTSATLKGRRLKSICLGVLCLQKNILRRNPNAAQIHQIYVSVSNLTI